MLDVPISFFYDDMSDNLASMVGLSPSTGSRRAANGFAEMQDSFGSTMDDTINRRETLELVRAYYRITDPSVRKRVFELVKSLVPDEPQAG